MITSRPSKKKAQLLSTILSLLILSILIVTGTWWPGLMLAIGLPLAMKQYLLGRGYDASVTLLVFVGTFLTVAFDFSWEIVLPILFSLGSIYVLFREWTDETSEAEREEDLNHEIEEMQQSHHKTTHKRNP